MKRKKNIVFILSDEQRYDTLGCNGNKTAKTPNIDHIAGMGTQFTNCFTPYPLCCPARASLWTSLMTHNHHVVENWRAIRPELRDAGLTKYFSQDGYYTTYTGKWHVPGTNPQRLHFDSWSAIPAVLEGRDRGRYIEEYREYASAQGYDLVPGHIENVTERDLINLSRPDRAPCATAEIALEHYLETWQTEKFLKELDNCPDDRPFFAVCSYNAPHFPMLVPEPYDSIISPEEAELSPNFCEGINGKPKEVYKSQYYTDTSYLNEYEWRRLIAHYWGLCSLIDTQVGRVVDYLKMAGKFENTIIVYTSDHGDMIGSHGLNQKGFAMHYDEVLRVPLIIRDPDSKANIHIDKLISLLDIIPTLAELVGIKITNETHGKSFASYFNNPCSENIRNYIVAETFKFADKELGSGFEGGQGEYIDLSNFNPEKNAYNLSIRARDEKYIFHWRDTDEFYDLNVDPFENCNLYENLEDTDRLDRLQRELLMQLRQTNCSLVDLVKSKIDLKKKELK